MRIYKAVIKLSPRVPSLPLLRGHVLRGHVPRAADAKPR
jgi:hypothetical protein